jgi:DNA-binding response OmpR family regulator
VPTDATQAPRVLVVEDDPTVRTSLERALESDGYAVASVPNGNDAAQLAATFRPDLAVLDVRLPEGPDGLAIARRLKADGTIPVLFLTAADTIDDRLAGFEAGADDYLVKPFAMAELLARVRAVLRRSGRLVSSVIQIEDVIVDENARTVTRSGDPIELTRTEFDLLLTLFRRQGQVLSKSQLLTLVWDFDAYDPNLVEVHMSSLRRKLEAHGPRVIQTVRGVGYIARP